MTTATTTSRRPASRALIAASLALLTSATGATAQAYQLTEKELAYDCKKLSGKIQVRILQIRNQPLQEKTTLASRGFQQVGKPIFGGTTYGADPDAQYRADKSMIEAYNARLVEKNCASFDLATALKPSTANDSPRPTIPAKASPAKAVAPKPGAVAPASVKAAPAPSLPAAPTATQNAAPSAAPKPDLRPATK